MKRDKQLMRYLLAQTQDGVAPPELAKYSEDERMYNAALLIDDGCIKGDALRGGDGSLLGVAIEGLTSAGHDLLEQMETADENPWATALRGPSGMQSATKPKPAANVASNSDPHRLIFISHSSADAELSDAIVDLLCTALRLRRKEFRCTSTAGSKLAGGAETATTLRGDIRSMPVFLSILTLSALNSHYVLFELGARWGVDMFHIPLLAKGAGPDVIKEPLKALNCLALTKMTDVLQLVEEVGSQLNRGPEPANAYHDKANRVVKLAGRGIRAASRTQRAPTPNRHNVEQTKSASIAGNRSGGISSSPQRNASRGKISPVDIAQTIKAAPLFSRGAVGNEFIGQHVIWDVYLQQMIPLRGNSMRIRFSPSPTELFPHVFCELQGKELKPLEQAHEQTLYQLRGRLCAVSENEIHLTNAKLKRAQ